MNELDVHFDIMIDAVVPVNHVLRNDAEYIGTLKNVFMCGARAGSEMVHDAVHDYTQRALAEEEQDRRNDAERN